MYPDKNFNYISFPKRGLLFIYFCFANEDVPLFIQHSILPKQQALPVFALIFSTLSS
jgi:hypothetical protein